MAKMQKIRSKIFIISSSDSHKPLTFSEYPSSHIHSFFLFKDRFKSGVQTKNLIKHLVLKSINILIPSQLFSSLHLSQLIPQ